MHVAEDLGPQVAHRVSAKLAAAGRKTDQRKMCTCCMYILNRVTHKDRDASFACPEAASRLLCRGKVKAKSSACRRYAHAVSQKWDTMQANHKRVRTTGSMVSDRIGTCRRYSGGCYIPAPNIIFRSCIQSLVQASTRCNVAPAITRIANNIETYR